MKSKIATFIFILVGLCLGFAAKAYLIKKPDVLGSSPRVKLTQNGENIAPNMTGVNDRVSDPVFFSIPRLGISAKIEAVELDIQNRMDVPKEPLEVGWYDLGPKPGQSGSAVIDGHLDTAKGPAIFFRLNQVNIGDEIDISDRAGKNYKFRVTDKTAYPENNFPIDTVFKSSDGKAHLNLITCGGVYNKALRLYDKRLVIFSELEN